MQNTYEDGSSLPGSLPAFREVQPMHPDDFTAQLAWVTAKRFQELTLKEPFAEKPVYYSFIGQCMHIP
ncbi:MAG: hypothetical protein M0Q92_02220 [Methanoregula sp.]|jgi:hypothetical protein|nr:hypothetical protein [Methanoregula sp.]